MPKLPVLNGGSTTREVIDTFAGYNHNLKINDGEFYFTENLTTQYYPLMASRPSRGRFIIDFLEPYRKADAPFAIGDFVTHDDKLYRCSDPILSPEDWTAAHWEEKESMFYDMQAITSVAGKMWWINDRCLYSTDSPRAIFNWMQNAVPPQLVTMGAYLCIFPDNNYVNTLDTSDKGSMEAAFSVHHTVDPPNPTIQYKMCHIDGTEFANVDKGSTAPVSPSAGDVWIDTTDGSAKEYSSSGTWVSLESVYTKICFSGDSSDLSKFKENDGVEIEYAHFDDINGSKILYGVHADNNGGGYIIVIGILEENYTDINGDFSVKRTVPDLDYVCEAQNRLWGCRYGKDSVTGEMFNEIMCCALGDFKNWNQYLGLSTDSWRASRGSDGPFTGCINYFGSPTFFKEKVIHTVSVSSVGAHQIGDIPGRGVQNGCSKSLAIVNETLYYKSQSDVMAYQGGIPVAVSEALGDVEYRKAVAGVHGQRYYISMQEGRSNSGPWHLFCYDVGKSLWMREDNSQVVDFAIHDGRLCALIGSTIYILNDEGPSTSVHWIAETGIQHYQYPDKKYVSRYNIRLQMAKGATAKLYIEYDSKGPWIFMGNISAGDIMTDNTGTANVPVRPRRCDHLRLRLEGTGTVRVLSITRVLQKGSDV